MLGLYHVAGFFFFKFNIPLTVLFRVWITRVFAVVTGSLTILANPPETWEPEAEFLAYFSKRKHTWSVRGCQGGQWIWAPCWVIVKEGVRQYFSLDAVRKWRDLCGWVCQVSSGVTLTQWVAGKSSYFTVRMWQLLVMLWLSWCYFILPGLDTN